MTGACVILRPHCRRKKVWGVGGVKKQRSAVGTALCGAFVLDTNTPHPAEMHRSGFWVPFATKRYKKQKAVDANRLGKSRVVARRLTVDGWRSTDPSGALRQLP